jgi:hypothetical protein
LRSERFARATLLTAPERVGILSGPDQDECSSGNPNGVFHGLTPLEARGLTRYFKPGARSDRNEAGAKASPAENANKR